MGMLLALKYRELKTGVSFINSMHREALDKYVLRLEAEYKDHFTRENLVYMIRHIYNTATHNFARVTAGVAKKIEWRARSVAHKSAKARQEGEQIRENDYLANVQNHKDSLNIKEVAEQHKL